jgi:hypothetical protein
VKPILRLMPVCRGDLIGSPALDARFVFSQCSPVGSSTWD